MTRRVACHPRGYSPLPGVFTFPLDESCGVVIQVHS